MHRTRRMKLPGPKAAQRSARKNADTDKWAPDHDIIFEEAGDKYPLENINKYEP